MAYVVTQACIGTKDRSCVEVCPVDCFYDIRKKELNDEYGKDPKRAGDFGMLVIHPDECINCGACETECPVEAIYEDSEVPDALQKFVTLNEREATSLSEEEMDELRCTEKLQ
jgi:NAD-dependent dihydropyrimidine dehydrogenase PreA subunit